MQSVPPHAQQPAGESPSSDPGPIESLAARLQGYRPRRLPGRQWVARCGVILLIADHGTSDDGAPGLLMMRRAERAGDPWSGHVSFPGGRVHPDDAGTRALRPLVEGGDRSVLTFGESAEADVRISSLQVDGPQASAWLVAADDEGTVQLAVPGRYNLHNAAAAYAIGRALGVPGAQLRRAAGAFRGTHRRFSFIGELNGARVYDYYAHHPTEVRALLTAARPIAGAARLVACFQPHLFSRTRDFAAEFGAALALADRVVVLDVYPAREDPIPGVTGELVAQAARSAGADVTYVPDKADAPRVLAGLLQPGDLALTIGAGDVTAIGPAAVALGLLGGSWR